MLLIAFLITHAGVGGCRPGAWHCTSPMTSPWREETKIAPKDELLFFHCPLDNEMQIGEAEGCRLCEGSVESR